MRRIWLLLGWAGMGCVGWGQAGSAKGDVGGVVVDARGGRPIAGAVVTLSGTGGGRVVATTRADAEGRFLLRGIGRGKYALRGEARGFEGANYQEHDEFSTAIAVGVGLETAGLRLELEPEAAIKGRVVDEVGEGVREARVTIYRESYEQGRRQVLPRTATVTDDRGEYEAGPLPAGRYFVSVSGRPWWAVYPRGEASAAGGVDPALDVAFPLTFAPGVTDSGRAGVVVVKAGEVARADVAMVPVRAATVTLRREGEGEGRGGGRVPTLQVPAFGGGEAIAAETEFSRDAVVLHGLAPGEYQMRTGEADEQVARVDVGAGSAEMRADAGAAAGTVVARVTEGDGGSLPGGVVLLLEQEGGTPGERHDAHVGGVTEKGEARVRGLPPGSYRVLAFDQQGALAVERMEVAGKEVRNGALAVGEGTTEVHVALQPAVKGIDGVVKRGGKPVAGAMVVLLPVDALGVPAMYRRDQSDQDGTFTLRGVVPGRYIVVAVEDGWRLEWSERGVMERYLSRGIAVEVKRGEHGQVQLPGVVEAQGR